MSELVATNKLIGWQKQAAIYPLPPPQSAVRRESVNPRNRNVLFVPAARLCAKCPSLIQCVCVVGGGGGGGGGGHIMGGFIRSLVSR